MTLGSGLLIEVGLYLCQKLHMTMLLQKTLHSCILYRHNNQCWLASKYLPSQGNQNLHCRTLRHLWPVICFIGCTSFTREYVKSYTKSYTHVYAWCRRDSAYRGVPMARYVAAGNKAARCLWVLRGASGQPGNRLPMPLLVFLSYMLRLWIV